MFDVIDRPVMCFEPTAALVQDENGSPVVSVQVYCDPPDGLDAIDPEVIRIYLEPLDGKRLALNLLGVSQEGITREIQIAKASREA